MRLLRSGGASRAIIPKQLEHIQLYVLHYILRYNREVVFFSAVALRKLHGICSTRSTALLWHLANAPLVQADLPHYGVRAETEHTASQPERMISGLVLK